MPMVLVVSPTSSDAVEALERCDWVTLPAAATTLRLILLNMLQVDRCQRQRHLALLKEGYRYPLGAPGCIAWLVHVSAATIGAGRDSRRIAESLLEQAPVSAERKFRFNQTSMSSVIPLLIAEADFVSSAVDRPIRLQISRITPPDRRAVSNGSGSTA